ncbi:MAG TPA: hypothetical protein VKA35_01065 [Solirubrobacterales bacterium]|nr:hypothetical protein [Solirubrobacterales bacterium]
MTVRVPKWLVWAAAALAVVGSIALAFAWGRSSGGDDPGGAAGRPAEAAVKEAVCSKPMAESATLETAFDDDIRAASAAKAHLEDAHQSEVPFFSEEQTDYQVAILECADLTDDGAAEMVVGLAAGASGRVFQWAIFSPDRDGNWFLAFDRTLIGASSLEIQGNSVAVRTATYGLDDPLCCPSGYKTSLVAYREGEFRVVSPTAPPPERLISIEEGTVTRLGLLRPLEVTPSQAVAAFGTPTAVSHYPDAACTYGWGDLGLKIVFANFGGGNPCGEAGRIGSFELIGSAAEQAGWHTAEGARVGSSSAALSRLYPGAVRSGEEMLLIDAPSPYGFDGTIDIATAFLADGEAKAYRFYIGAAGE